ncbi:hypothetical protein LLG90_23480 [Aromatoleum toluclasticum]|uniref:hypothetical protein n=1 Tax=Aromatoleum toluclasticum TaxID=92003 RepID=UPI001D18C6DB|nr:hypothetical protein [Aromatoleum toluclasticum]MCC4118320.1 hypothetical protein [Aromatoleum toluclasticum]
MTRAAVLTCVSACLLAWLPQAQGAAAVEVCFNYGCASRVEVVLAEDGLAGVAGVLAQATDADSERAAIARAVGMMQRLSAGQAPIAADRGGNYRDDDVAGRMDCIDHSTTTTHFLELMAARGWLRFHRVLAVERRAPYLVLQHFSAVIEETDAPAQQAAVLVAPAPVPDHIAPMLALCDCGEVLADIGPALALRPEAGPAPVSGHSPGARFAVDSWFVDHGEPAVVLPLAEWLNGEGPNVQ